MRLVSIQENHTSDGRIFLPAGTLRRRDGEPGAVFIVPKDILEEAGLPCEEELEVRVVPGAILIGLDDPMDVVYAPLLEMLQMFGMDEDEVYGAIEKGGYFIE